MSPLAITFLAASSLLVIYNAWAGWRQGASTEIRHLLANFFAVLVAVRFWHPWSETISGGLTFDPRWVALGSFVLLYVIGLVVASFVVKAKAQAYQSVKPDTANRLLGVLGGAFTGALLGSCLLWLGTIAQPGKLDSAPAVKAFAGWPRDIVRAIETNIAGVAPDSAGRTRYPQVALVEIAAEGTPVDTTGGAVLMQQRGSITWQ